MATKKKNKVRTMEIPPEYEMFLQWWTPLTGSDELESFELIWPHSKEVYKVVLEEGYNWNDYVTSRRAIIAPGGGYGDYYGVIKFKSGKIKSRSYYDENWRLENSSSKETKQ